jgi:hypothetical protein
VFVFKRRSAKDVSLRIFLWRRAVAVDGERIERGQGLAFDEVVQVARREDQS